MCNTNTPQVVVFALALSGYAYLWLAIVVDVGSMLAVTLNGLTLLKPERKRKKTCGRSGAGKTDGDGDGNEKKAACASAVTPSERKKKKGG